MYTKEDCEIEEVKNLKYKKELNCFVVKLVVKSIIKAFVISFLVGLVFVDLLEFIPAIYVTYTLSVYVISLLLTMLYLIFKNGYEYRKFLNSCIKNNE